MGPLPTTHLYFLNACRDGVRGWMRRGPIRKLGANCYAAGDTVLLIRRDSEGLMRRLGATPPKRFLYLIDDDVEAARNDSSLPHDYRRRLIRFHDQYHSRFVAMAETLIVTSPVLLERFSAHRDVRLLHPVWDPPAADDRHFNALTTNSEIHAAHLGTGSHIAGLRFLKPILEVLLQRHPTFHFTYVGRTAALDSLDTHPRVHRVRPQSWSRYRRWLAQNHFHLAFYPLPDTPFNRARSRNKLLEHGMVGAVGVYSRSWPTAAQMDGCAILAGETAQDWIGALEPYLDQPTRLQSLARAARPVLQALNDARPQRQFWSDLFDVAF